MITTAEVLDKAVQSLSIINGASCIRKKTDIAVTVSTCLHFAFRCNGVSLKLKARRLYANGMGLENQMISSNELRYALHATAMQIGIDVDEAIWYKNINSMEKQFRYDCSKTENWKDVFHRIVEHISLVEIND
jgi:hypothetical protein